MSVAYVADHCHHSDDVSVDVVDGKVTIKVVDIINHRTTSIPLTNDAARLIGSRLLIAADMGDVREVNTAGWDEIPARAKAYVAKCKRIAEAIEAPGWMSHDVQMVARAIL